MDSWAPGPTTNCHLMLLLPSARHVTRGPTFSPGKKKLSCRPRDLPRRRLPTPHASASESLARSRARRVRHAFSRSRSGARRARTETTTIAASFFLQCGWVNRGARSSDDGSVRDVFVCVFVARRSGRGRCGGETASSAGADPDAVAQSYWHVHAQDRSAWTQEMDIRSPSLM